MILRHWRPGDARTRFPAFSAYGHSRPDGIELARLQPYATGWVEDGGPFVLPYKAVHGAPDPAGAVLDFLTSAYDASAARVAWRGNLVSAEPSPPGTAG